MCCAVLCLVVQSCLTLCDPMDGSPPGPLSIGVSRQEYWSGLPCPPQGIFPTQGSNTGFPHCRWILYCLSHQGSLMKTIGSQVVFSFGAQAAPSWLSGGSFSLCATCGDTGSRALNPLPADQSSRAGHSFSEADTGESL